MDIKELEIEESDSEDYKVLLKDCYDYANEKGKHPTTHNAALLVRNGEVILRGANILPPGVEETKERYEGDNRHIYPNHAERDLVFKAARQGIATDGLIMVMPWLPCINCANAVISSGIKKLIVHKAMIEKTREAWQAELRDAVSIMREAGVGIVAYNGVVGTKVYMNREEHDI